MALRPALRRLVIDFCNREAAAQIAFIRDRFGLSETYNPGIYVTFYRETFSIGGIDVNDEPFITISAWDVRNIIGTNECMEYEEYDHINEDAEIGKVAECNWKRYLACLIAHELAHTLTLVDVIERRAIVGNFFPDFVQLDTQDEHGLLWQGVYRIIRAEYVNPKAYYTRFVYPSMELTREIIRKPPNEERYIYIYHGRHVAYYARDTTTGMIYLSDRDWKVKRATTFKNLFDVRRHLTT